MRRVELHVRPKRALKEAPDFSDPAFLFFSKAASQGAAFVFSEDDGHRFLTGGKQERFHAEPVGC
jgi:hypothetical protein